MHLTIPQVAKILSAAANCIGQKISSEGFQCLNFARNIYRLANVEIPVLSTQPPPDHLNIRPEELLNPPPGHLIFLKSRSYEGGRAWTHVAILGAAHDCYHWSRSNGGRVVRSALADLFQEYEFAPSLSLTG
jgi:cell wall-associated NlpC family hydrolase